MNTSTAALKAQLDLHTRLFNNVTEGITDNESGVRNSEHINNMKWIAGHLLNTRLGNLSKIAGLQPDESYGPLFGRGNSYDPAANYPPIEEIKAKWQATAEAISAGIGNMPEDVAASKSPVQAPIADDTMRGLAAFLVSHEAYHIGQLGMLRKMIGKEAMSFK